MSPKPSDTVPDPTTGVPENRSRMPQDDLGGIGTRPGRKSARTLRQCAAVNGPVGSQTPVFDGPALTPSSRGGFTPSQGRPDSTRPDSFLIPRAQSLLPGRVLDQFPDFLTALLAGIRLPNFRHRPFRAAA